MEEQAVETSVRNGAETSAQPAARPRLDYLDGLRGWAALYVVIHHAYLQSTDAADRFELRTPLTRALHWLDFGHYAVAIFIVLSGYCLMIPLAKSRQEPLRGGFFGYIYRRAKRILPPYYAAILFTFVLMLFEPRLTERMGFYWDVALPEPHTAWSGGLVPNILRELELPAYGTGTMLSHLFLVHNWVKSWMYQIGYPLWSVATEWQIYFFFPLLLFIRRKSGYLLLAITVILLGAGTRLLPNHQGEQGSPWFITAFGLGMLGAVINFSTERQPRFWRDRLPWGGFAAALFGIFFGLCAFRTDIALAWNWFWVMDMLVGFAVLCLLVACTRALQNRKRNPILMLFEARPSVFLGKFSYSLYLIHAPLLAWMHTYLRIKFASETTVCLLMFALGVPFCLLGSYLFYLLCERPFLSTAAKSRGGEGEKGKMEEKETGNRGQGTEHPMTQRPNDPVTQ